MVGVTNGSTAVLECETEAFPEPLRYDTLVSLFTVYWFVIVSEMNYAVVDFMMLNFELVSLVTRIIVNFAEIFN